MALTTTQVNAAFVALLGRAAEGNANAWAVNSADTTTLANTILSVDGKFKDQNSLEKAKTNEDFVGALYETILGRAADAEGKAFWLKALTNGTSRDELKANFLAAAKANNEDLSKFDTSNQEFLSSVYSALLNRGVDSSGLEYWKNLLNNGTSRAEVVASIIEAINANQASEDYAIYNAKMSVANAVTAAFAGPKAGLNAEQSEELNKQLVSIMSSVTSADVTEESIKSLIDNVVGSYGKEAAPLAFKAVTDNMEAYDLGNADSTSAQTFRGTINLQDDKKSTISNKATLKTSKFSDTLVVDVIPSIENKAFNYSDSPVKTFAGNDGIKNLTINNGTAKITNLDSKGISQNLKITGSADVSGSVTSELQYLEVNTGGSADATATITVNANLKEYVGKGSGKDEITISGADAAGAVKVDKINTGAGDDKLTVSGSGSVVNVDLGSGKDTLTVSGADASLTGTINLGAGNDTLTVSGASISGATINLGAGDDKITLAGVAANGLSGATIDGGDGRDTLIVSGDISTKGDFTLKNVEVLTTSGAATVSKALLNGESYKLSNADLITVAASDGIDLSKMTVVDGKTSSGFAITGVSGGEVKLSATNAGIKETITLAAEAKGANAVTITGFAADTNNKAANDKLLLTGVLENVAGAGAESKLTNWSTAGENTTSKIYLASASLDDLNDLATKSHALFSRASLSASSGKVIVAVTNDGDGKELTAFYLVSAASQAKTIDTVTLIGTIDQDVSTDWKADNTGLYLA